MTDTNLTLTNAELDAAAIIVFANKYANRAALVLTGTTTSAQTLTKLYNYTLNGEIYNVYQDVDLVIHITNTNTQVTVKIRAIVKG